MMTKLIAKSGALLLALLLCVPGFGHDKYYAYDNEEEVSLPYHNLVMENRNSYRLTLGHDYRQVREVKFDAGGSCRDGGKVNVFVNGSYKGKIQIECGRRNYTIPVNEGARHVDIYHESGPAVTIYNVWAVTCERPMRPVQQIIEATPYQYPHPITVVAVPQYPLPISVVGVPHFGEPRDPEFEDVAQRHFPSKAAWLAARTELLVDSLWRDVDAKTEWVPYLEPIKTAATRAKAKGKAIGDGRDETKEAMAVLLTQIDFAEPLIESLLKKNSTNDRAGKLLELRDDIAIAFGPSIILLREKLKP